MLEKCVKCSEKTEPNYIRVAGGKAFILCKLCDEFLNDHPAVNFLDYIGPKYNTWLSKNIKEAWKARKEGKSPWKDKLSPSVPVDN